MNISILISPIDAHNLIEVVSPFKFMHPQLPHPLMPPCCCLTKITMQYHYSSCCEAGREKKALSKPFFLLKLWFFPSVSQQLLSVSLHLLWNSRPAQKRQFLKWNLFSIYELNVAEMMGRIEVFLKLNFHEKWKVGKIVSGWIVALSAFLSICHKFLSDYFLKID